MNKKIISKVVTGMLACTMVAYTAPVFAYTKDETVYSKIDVNGKSYKTIVNDHLENDENVEIINDISDLLNIKNVNGDETYTQDGTSLVWNADESDIYYQGETDKELPIECEVTYELNGEEISADDIAGKSGNVKITIKYTNKDEHQVNINGTNETLFTPFVVVCGTIIDNDNNKNIEITNGKKIDNGNQTVLIGISLPGLQESLGISEDDIEIPEQVEISMETTSFELGNIVSYVTPKVLEESDLSIFDEIDEIYSQIETLQNSSKQLVEGANTLKAGTETYSEKSQEFNSAMKTVQSGINSASKSYSQIDSGISTINKSASTLQSGAKSISEGSEAISTNLETISEKLGELQTGTASLQEGEAKLSAGINQVISGVNNIEVTDYSSKITELNTLISTNQKTIDSLTATNKQLNAMLESETDTETITTLKTQIETNKSMITLLEANVKANKEIVSTLESTDTSSIDTLKAGLNSIKQGMAELQEGTDTLYEGTSSLKSGAETLASKSKELSTGASTLYNGTTQLTEGTKTLSSGSSQMKSGLETLSSGTDELTSANDQLTEGAETLNEGATTLAEGITQFDEEGIQKICNYINGDLKDITDRVEALQELSEEYNNFTMLSDEGTGNVKFIMIMDSIKVNEDNKEEAIINETVESKEE